MQNLLKLVRAYTAIVLLLTIGTTMQHYIDVYQSALIELLVLVWVWCGVEIANVLLPYFKKAKENPQAVLVPTEFADKVVAMAKDGAVLSMPRQYGKKLLVKRFYSNKTKAGKKA